MLYCVIHCTIKLDDNIVSSFLDVNTKTFRTLSLKSGPATTHHIHAWFISGPVPVFIHIHPCFPSEESI